MVPGSVKRRALRALEGLLRQRDDLDKEIRWCETIVDAETDDEAEEDS
jgi:hypothetical protein